MDLGYIFWIIEFRMDLYHIEDRYLVSRIVIN